ncbi:MAG: hypothetical protein RL179_1899 [Planctomycetota bacterium]
MHGPDPRWLMNHETDMLVAALRKVVASGGEHLLFKVSKQEGMFAAKTGLAGEVAQTALDRQFIELVRSEGEGKKLSQWVKITAKGIRFLHERESPVRALDEAMNLLKNEKEITAVGVVRMQERLQEISDKLLLEAANWTQKIESLEKRILDALSRLEQAGPLVPPAILKDVPWSIEVVRYLQWRRGELDSGKCPLPELFEMLQNAYSYLDCSSFHEGLKKLFHARVIRLEGVSDASLMDKPEFALLDSGQVYYFACR